MSCSIVILAAGIGSRMKSTTPKVLHKICGREMLYYIIKEAQKISDDISIIVYHEAQKITKMVMDNFDNINCVHQEHKKFPGTGGAIMSFLQQYTPKYKSLLVLNGDMPLVQATELHQFLGHDSQAAVMSILELNDGSGYGRVIIEQGMVQKIIEEKDATVEQKRITTVNAGVYLFPIDMLQTYLPHLSCDNAQNEYYLTDVISLMLRDSKKLVPIIVDEYHFKGVNTKQDLSIAESMMLSKIRKFWQEEGVIMHLSDTIYIDERAKFIGECEIEQGVQIHGESTLESTHIKAYTVIEDSMISHSDIGPFAHIRPHSVIKNTHIGNFVETKKAHLDGIKAGHLSYLGDCEIGNGSNIGAGTITCNYDGIAKHRTIIGKNVFVGSDTQLVAPVNIGDNVLIAAGSTITKDIETGSLGIARTPQSNVSGFYEKFFKPSSLQTDEESDSSQLRLKINGEWTYTQKDASVLDVLCSLGIDSKVIAIAINGEILKKEQWSEYKPYEGDELELLHFVGGG